MTLACTLPAGFGARRAGTVSAGIGAGIVIASNVLGAGLGGGLGTSPALLALIPFTLWALVPYGAVLVLSRLVSWPWAVAGAGAAVVAAEIGVRLAVFVFPRGSTAASPARCEWSGGLASDDLPRGADGASAAECARASLDRNDGERW